MGGLTCSVCSSKNRRAIEKALVEGLSLRVIARRYGPSRSAIARHKAHVAESLAKAAEVRQIDFGSTLLDRLAGLQEDFRRLAAKAEATGEWGPAALAVREARETLKLISELRESVSLGKQVIEVGFRYGGSPEIEHANKAALHFAERLVGGNLEKPQVNPARLLTEDKSDAH